MRAQPVQAAWDVSDRPHVSGPAAQGTSSWSGMAQRHWAGSKGSVHLISVTAGDTSMICRGLLAWCEALEVVDKGKKSCSCNLPEKKSLWKEMYCSTHLLNESNESSLLLTLRNFNFIFYFLIVTTK